MHVMCCHCRTIAILNSDSYTYSPAIEKSPKFVTFPNSKVNPF